MDLEMNCREVDFPQGSEKGIGKVYECFPYETLEFEDIESLKKILERALIEENEDLRLDFSENESIGYTHMLYKFSLMRKRERCASVRVAAEGRRLLSVVIVLSRGCDIKVGKEMRGFREERESRDEIDHAKGSSLPPGQTAITDFIIYRILGQPEVSLDKWKLRIFGEVEKELELSYDDLISLGTSKIRSDFHCVTGWSVREVELEGVPTRKLNELAMFKDSAKWVYAYSEDGYTAPIPIEDFLAEGSMIALKMNGKPLSKEQGFPARLFIPHLYGWKGAKWINALELRREYRDGYWEALGYHERGNVWKEERFKRR